MVKMRYLVIRRGDEVDLGARNLLWCEQLADAQVEARHMMLTTGQETVIYKLIEAAVYVPRGHERKP